MESPQSFYNLFSFLSDECRNCPHQLAHGLMVNQTDVLLVPGKDGDGVVTLSKTDNVSVLYTVPAKKLLK